MPRKHRWKYHTPATSSKATRVPKRTHAKIRSRLKRRYQLCRRQMGALGAGQRLATREEAERGIAYETALAGALELARFRRLV